MNRYRTVPGLGPSASKASSNTTCQKCLKKGHYSYECKASVQSRPYISRPSRSQQLQNPKLKPALAEQKMQEPTDKLLSPKQDSAIPQSAKPGLILDMSEDASLNTSSKKRRRSASLSSTSSVATFSTGVSEPRAEDNKPETIKRRRADTRSRSLTDSRSRSPPRFGRHRESHHDENRESHRFEPGTRPEDSDRASDSDGYPRRRAKRKHDEPGYTDKSREGHRGRGRSGKRASSQDLNVLPGEDQRHRVSDHPIKQRSLSPYSRRLALTQAMNSGG